jgi:hypothetical protein
MAEDWIAGDPIAAVTSEAATGETTGGDTVMFIGMRVPGRPTRCVQPRANTAALHPLLTVKTP